MSKREFLARLRRGLVGLPQDDLEERLIFYSEMIDDRMEEGLSEEEAIIEIGSVDQVISNIIDDTPLTDLVKEKIRPKRTLRVWEIVLLVLGAPLWLSLLIAFAAVIFSVYIVFYSVIISLWAVMVSVGATVIAAIVLGFVAIIYGNTLPGIALFGLSLFCAGLTVFCFFGCKAATKGTIFLTKKSLLGIKYLFVGKEGAR